MTDDERSFVANDISRLAAFLSQSQSSCSFVSEMVAVDKQSLAFDGFGRFKMRPVQEIFRERSDSRVSESTVYTEPMLLET